MKLIFSKNLGYCAGVKRAIDFALQNRPHICTLGELTHNERVLDMLKSNGINAVNSIDEINEPKVVIRSHGVSQKTLEELKEKNLEVIDATCPFVKKIHEIVLQKWKEGYHIVIVGDPLHPEVQGINGWCDFTADVIDENSDLSSLYKYENLCFVSQTTFPEKKYSIIKQNFATDRVKTVEFFDTICYTTKVRQIEAQKIASCCSIVLVLGSKKSKNTNMLCRICERFNKRVFLVENLSDVKKIIFSPVDSVGILAGASTPEELIMEVKSYMSQNVGEVQVSDELKTGVEESLMSYREGKRVKGLVISADDKGVRVNIGGKYDGIIYSNEANLDGSYEPSSFVKDTEVEAIIIGKKDQDTDCILLSKKKVDLIKEGDKVVDTIRNGETFELMAHTDTKGGLLAKLGTYTVFIPASQIKERGFPKDLKTFVKKPLRLTALEIDDDKHKIIASQSKVLERERKEREEIFWTHVMPNVVVSGTVKRTTNFGAFVSVDGFDCLAHIVDLSWNHIKSVDEVLKIGETYDFLVLSADREKNRVSLGYKQLQPHPFTVAMEKHPVGSVTKGQVVSIVPFGAFVQIEPGVEGLVHVSEAANTYVKNINEIVKVGEEVEVKILAVDEGARRITLSMKACLPVEEQSEQEQYEKVEMTEEEKDARNKKFANRPAKKTERKPKSDDDSRKEWNEDSSNNPFAALLMNYSTDEEEAK